jgi:hypothetical protein
MLHSDTIASKHPIDATMVELAVLANGREQRDRSACQDVGGNPRAL